MNIKQIAFKGFNAQETTKKQIYLHHTAGGADATSTFKFWESDPLNVGTCVAISRDGQIVQGFDSKFWAYNLGLKSSHFLGLPYKNLDKSSIGIEICNWGYLVQKGTKFYNYVGKEVKDVCKLDTPYKGYQYFENYTTKQIESVRELLLLWRDKYAIDLTYHEDIWQVTKRALSGKNGVYTHNSVRKDKIDVYPHPQLIEMLNDL
jgi:N-acetyl-anhydromuramyl-L-alanine amidase AmpD